MNALVTGGTRGIGLAIVNTLTRCGYNVTGIDRGWGDLSQRHARHGIVQAFIDDHGGIDILINNAGEQFFHPALEYPATQWDHNLALMLTAPFELSVEAARWMLKHGGGHIVNILSTSAFHGVRNVAGYVAAKHGLLGLTRALAIEWAPLVHVNAVAPGLTETEMTDRYITPERKAFLNSITPGGRFCKPEEIAEAALFLVRSAAMYGQVITVDQGWMAKNG